MFLPLIKTSKSASPCQRMARKAFALAAGQHVPAAKRLLESWSERAVNPVIAINGFDYAKGHPGLVWRGMN